MILEADTLDDLRVAFDKIGLAAVLERSRSLALKVNLVRPPESGHPRSDSCLMKAIARYAGSLGVSCTIIEAADGHLEENLRCIGLGRWLDEGMVSCLDLDETEVEQVTVPDGQIHYLPICLRDFDIRMAHPLTSLRPGMVFSNNVKLFVGLVPRAYYQDGPPGVPRPRIHADLHRSIASLYQAVMSYAPFHFYVNVGPILVESSDVTSLGKYLVSDDGLELDRHVLRELGLSNPEYLERLLLGL